MAQTWLPSQWTNVFILSFRSLSTTNIKKILKFDSVALKGICSHNSQMTTKYRMKIKWSDTLNFLLSVSTSVVFSRVLFIRTC
jgi:hypothetical protein